MTTLEKDLSEIIRKNLPEHLSKELQERLSLIDPLQEENKIYMSAKTKVGLKELIEMISKRIYSDYLDCNMLIPYDKGNIISYLNQNATIFNTEYTEEGTIVFLNCKDTDYNKYKEYVIE
jgi:GTP-binding protein HflX